MKNTSTIITQMRSQAPKAEAKTAKNMIGAQQIEKMLAGVKNQKEVDAVRAKLLQYHTGGQLAISGDLVAQMIEQRRRQLTGNVQKVDLIVNDVLISKDTTQGSITDRLYRVVEVNEGNVHIRQLNTPESAAIVVPLSRLSQYEKYNEDMSYVEQRPSVTPEEKSLAAENKTQNQSFLQDPAAVKLASDEAEKKSAKEIDDDFFNNLGCK